MKPYKHKNGGTNFNEVSIPTFSRYNIGWISSQEWGLKKVKVKGGNIVADILGAQSPPSNCVTDRHVAVRTSTNQNPPRQLLIQWDVKLQLLLL